MDAALHAPADVLIEDERREVRKYPDWTPGVGEGWGHYVYRLCTEGHTYFDALLLAAGAVSKWGSDIMPTQAVTGN